VQEVQDFFLLALRCLRKLLSVAGNYELKVSVKDIGAGIRQLARLTGVSFGVIQKL
jgi:hypothetical protein